MGGDINERSNVKRLPLGANASSTFVLIGLVLVAMLACGTVAANHETSVVPALVGVACLVAATAIWGVAFHTTLWGRITEGIWSGSSSLTYANAAAGILGPMTLLTMAKAANQDGRLYAVAGTLTAIGLISALAPTYFAAALVPTPSKVEPTTTSSMADRRPTSLLVA